MSDMANTNGASAAGLPDRSPEDLMTEVQELSERLGEVADPGARLGEQLVGAVIDLYGEGLARIVQVLEEAGEAAATVRRELIEDGVVASLLLIHGLYPVPVEERVQEALEGVRPYLESHGGGVELVGVRDGVAELRLQGSCNGCPASAATLELAIRQALEEAAPDLVGLEVEGVAASVHSLAPALKAPAWVDLAGVAGLADGALMAASVEDLALLVARVDGTLLAYRNACAACGSALETGVLDAGGTVQCPACEARYSLPAAGRALADGAAALEPVPLLAQDTAVRVAVRA